MDHGETTTSTGRGAHTLAVVALLAGIMAAVFGLVWLAVDDAAELAVPLLSVGLAVAVFGALLLLAAPLYRPDPGTGRRFAQVAVPILAAGVVAPAVAVVSAAALDGITEGDGSRVVAGVPFPGRDTPMSPVSAVGSAGGAGTTAGHDHGGTPSGPGVTAGENGMAPTGPVATVSPEAMGSLEDQIRAALIANGGLPSDAVTGSSGGTTPDASTPAASTPAASTPAASTPASTDPTAVLAAQVTSAHDHGEAVPEQPLDRATRAELGTQLAAARAVAEQYRTVADAEAAGYRMVTPYLPLIGAHYVRWGLMDGTFDVAEPEMLLYDGTGPDAGIVGLSYYVFGAEEPAGFAGPNDHWHQHVGLCLRGGVVVAGEASTAEQCRALGGQKVDAANGWMVHAWVVPGWESPQGVFSPDHAGLT